MPDLTGTRGRPAEIDLENGHLVYAKTDNYTIGTKLSIGIWVRTPAGASVAVGDHIYGANDTPTGDNEFMLRTDPNILFNVGPGNYNSGADLLGDNEWHFLVGVFDAAGATNADKYKLFVDTAFDTNGSVGGTPEDNITAQNMDITVGADAAGDNGYPGRARSGFIVRAALTAEQCLALKGVLARRDHSYAYHMLAEYAGGAGNVFHHFQPTWAGNMSVVEPRIACQDWATGDQPTIGGTSVSLAVANLPE